MKIYVLTYSCEHDVDGGISSVLHAYAQHEQAAAECRRLNESTPDWDIYDVVEIECDGAQEIMYATPDRIDTSIGWATGKSGQ